MIDYIHCDSKIKAVLLELDKYVLNYIDGEEGWATRDTREVLETMKDFCVRNKPFNDRLIRAFIDVSVVSVRNFENTTLGEAIYSLSSYFYEVLPEYKSYKPLGVDFGKGEPF
ncbi:hypothetical protein J2X69_002425 [Algoriphagus sp. 4150]|uniref:hypothetical protein n=1 Tax=Algoriphagus sp. 4150 TaxID=2817756 RepID=UPI00285F7A53|nr:hypothetical protein [Algoriphagus sp. 4150]MDR7130078.1 hypothetical protein [Algoriphagus sp. 4150]